MLPFDQQKTESTEIALGVFILINELIKSNNKIKELENEVLTLKKEKELLNNNLKLSEEIRQYSSENKILELREEIKYLKKKIVH